MPVKNYENTELNEKPGEQPGEQPEKNKTKKPVKKDGKKPAPRGTYVLRKTFSWDNCSLLSQKYKLAVYQNCKDGTDAQSRAVMAILHHEQDYPGSTAEEKAEYHQYCGSWCDCKMWEIQKKPLEEFTRSKTKNIHGEDVVWRAGF